MSSPATNNQQLTAAYQHCREVARARARNFYYSFVALPPAKRDAMCAVYAFMRLADDISDEPTQPVTERRTRMAEWLAAWKLVEAGGATGDPVFLALRDAQQRFSIPGAWLDQLVQGTTLDLDDAFPVYPTFEDLYRYCYLVASVVGLVCIRIFGYDDPRAEQLAERTGIAFQLTNILRDVAEDAGMGRVYIPESELQAVGLTRDDLLDRNLNEIKSQLQPVLVKLGAQAESYYAAAQELIPLIHPDSRPSLRVLVRIYHRLLQRIQANGYDVFSERIAVPSYQKLFILAQGLLNVLWQKAATSRP